MYVIFRITQVYFIAQSCPTLCDPLDWSSARLLCPWNSSASWSGLPFPPPGDLPDLGIKSASLVSLDWLADSLPAEPVAYLLYLLGKLDYHLGPSGGGGT